MIKLSKLFRYNQNFVPCGLSALAPGLIFLVHLYGGNIEKSFFDYELFRENKA